LHLQFVFTKNALQKESMGKKKKFHFNPETLNYEQIEYTFAYKLKRFFVHIMTGLFSGIILFFVFTYMVDSPREKQLLQANRKMQSQYKLLERQLNEYQLILSDIQQRDDNLYRVIFQADPIPLSVRRSITPNAEFYADLMKKTNAQIVVSTTQRLNEMRKQLYVQSKSLDEVVELMHENETRLAHIPAIWPISDRDLTRIASGFGMRIHPIFRVLRFHSGMDFTAPTGTEVFATGNGTVERTGWEQGYGNTIRIDHGFGYVSLYAHLSKINVRVGQQVSRGEVIGLVGNTGTSAGPHLHYEVHYRGIAQNPQNFFFLDLSPEEHDLMMQMSNNAGQMY
jgi:murein DD-endopeptidase MepM/ murein hydrolase activator NlpD